MFGSVCRTRLKVGTGSDDEADPAVPPENLWRDGSGVTQGKLEGWLPWSFNGHGVQYSATGCEVLDAMQCLWHPGGRHCVGWLSYCQSHASQGTATPLTMIVPFTPPGAENHGGTEPRVLRYNTTSLFSVPNSVTDPVTLRILIPNSSTT